MLGAKCVVRLLLLFLVIFISVNASAGARDLDLRSMLTVLDRFSQAYQNHDLAALDALYSEELIYMSRKPEYGIEGKSALFSRN